MPKEIKLIIVHNFFQSFNNIFLNEATSLPNVIKLSNEIA